MCVKCGARRSRQLESPQRTSLAVSKKPPHVNPRSALTGPQPRAYPRQNPQPQKRELTRFDNDLLRTHPQAPVRAAKSGPHKSGPQSCQRLYLPVLRPIQLD
jgi:hypothetical protein